MEETALTVEEAMLLKVFYECGLSTAIDCQVTNGLNYTNDEISLCRKVTEKANKHFYFILSRIQSEVSKMNKFRRKIDSWDFNPIHFNMFVDRHLFYTSAYINSPKSIDIIYFLFTEELFTIPAAKLIDGRVPIFESIQSAQENRLNAQILNLNKRWKSIY